MSRIVECYVCHQSVAVPPTADRDTRWVHAHCLGNTPTVSELVIGYLTAFPRERFCVDCLTRRIGLSSRKPVDAALDVLGSSLRVTTGRCARCPATTRVVGMSESQVAARS